MELQKDLQVLLSLSPKELHDQLISKSQSDPLYELLYMLWSRGRTWGIHDALHIGSKTNAQVKEFFERVENKEIGRYDHMK